MSNGTKSGWSKADFTVRNPAGNAPLDHRETADRYRGEIFRKGRFRVILCRDGIQWILQRKKGGAGARWQALGYFTTRKALTRLWTASTGEAAPEIARLPETVGGCERWIRRPSAQRPVRLSCAD